MDAATKAVINPIALRREEGEAVWFLGALAIIKASGEATGGRTAIIEILAPEGSGSPLHVHNREDEWFYVLEGELSLWVGGRLIKTSPGSFVYGPRGIPHTFMVTSPRARYLLVAQPAGFENFMRALSRPAKTLTIPPAATEPPGPEHLSKIAAAYGIEILGPPGIPDDVATP
ncbi:MAG TPA: quercetin 2,3-dioxygenase [Methyloceanibacter sp.]|nr:quercetin 2,3-dioxygenase [Methyloceanibacter sp.]